MIRGLLACLLLVGCAAKPVTITKIELVSPHIPQALLNCPTSPTVPVATRQSQVADYVAALWRAHAICFDHLSAVRQTLATSQPPGEAPQAAAGSTR